ncbi:MAG: hypothetical protein AAF468_12520 [Pseudomonadota bacterium]
MTRPTPQTCEWCMQPFVGSDALGKPCDECRAKYGLKVLGVGRDAENAQALSVVFNRELTNEELRAIHDWLRTAATCLTPPKPFEIRGKV